MRPFIACTVFVGCLSLAACGKDSEPAKAGPATPAASAPSTKPTPPMPVPTPAPTVPPKPAAAPAASDFTGAGVVEVQGISIAMQGTHKLVDGGKTVCLLESKKVDLKAHEGKKVKLSGPSRPTVEGGQTIVDVQTIEDLP
jgi:hypothetical protein